MSLLPNGGELLFGPTNSNEVKYHIAKDFHQHLSTYLIHKVFMEILKDVETIIKQYDESGDPAELARAASLTNDFGSLLPPNYKPHHYRAAAHVRAKFLLRRFTLSADRKDLGTAVKLHGEILGVDTSGYRDGTEPALVLHQLTGALVKWGEAARLETLRDAFTYAEAALTLAPAAAYGPLWLSTSFELASSLKKWAGKQARLPSLHATLEQNRAVLSVMTTDHPIRIHYLGAQSTILANLYNLEGELSHLEEAITMQRGLLQLIPQGQAEHAKATYALGCSLRTLCTIQYDPEILEEAMQHFRKTVELGPEGPEKSLWRLHTQLAACYHTRYEHHSRTEDLNEQIVFHREVRRLTQGDSTAHINALTNLGSVLKIRFRVEGDIGDLEESMNLQREVSRLDLEAPNRSSPRYNLENLADSLLDSFEYFGRREDLDEAIPYAREGLARRSQGHATRHVSLQRLAIDLTSQYKVDGDPVDLEESITLLEESLDSRKAGSTESGHAMTGLVGPLLGRFAYSKEMGDLETALEYQERALELIPVGHIARPKAITNLGYALLVSFKHRGRAADLDRSVAFHREAMETHSPKYWRRGAILIGLGRALHARFQGDGRAEDLNEAISLHLEALEITPPGHSDLQDIQTAASAAFLTRYKDQGLPSDLEKAIKYHDQMLTLPQQLGRSWMTKQLLKDVVEGVSELRSRLECK